MTVRRLLPLVLIVLAAFGLGYGLRGSGDDGDSAADAPAPVETGPTIWTCSMHPQVRQPEPGLCPLCAMDLIPLEDDGDAAGPTEVRLSEAAAALADIRTAPVERMAVDAPVRLRGRVAADQTRVRVITARVGARVDTLLVDEVGRNVRAGQPVASLYSPELYAAQAELLASLGTPVADDARARLRLWGLDDGAIAAIERRGAPASHLRLPAPVGGTVLHLGVREGDTVAPGARLMELADLSRVWVLLDAYESDLPRLAVGQTAEMELTAAPGRVYPGEIVLLDPVVDPATRTVAVRVEVPNADGRLRPGMDARAVIRVPAAGEAPLTIPATAPLLTGERAVVYVKLPDRDEPTFEGRVITLGPRAGDRYVVADGLREGELVAARGAFKLDSALQIQAKPSMMNPDPQAAPAAPAGIEVNAAFRARLGDVLAVYLDLQAALADDDDAAAATAAARAPAALDAVDAAPGHHRPAAWREDGAALRAAFRAVADAPDIAARRAPLQALTDALWTSLRRYGRPGDAPVRLFHCPMAYDDTGGDWIQRGETTDNPYFGSMMLRCGTQKAVLAADGTVAR